MLKELSKAHLSGAVKQRTIDDRYHLLANIGTGRFGEVYLAWDSLAEKLVALKELKDLESFSSLEHFLLEIEILLKVKSRNPSASVTTILGFGLSPECGAYYAMTFNGLSNFFEFLARHGEISEDRARHFFAQLLRTVAGLHALGFAHLDLKPENVLITEEGKLILCDFGSSKILDKVQDGTLGSFSQEYAAPEVLQSTLTATQTALDFRRLDSFSLGVVLFVMLFKSNPFRKADLADPYYRRLVKDAVDFWKTFAPLRQLSPQLKDLLETLLTAAPDARPYPQDLLKHPWLMQTKKSQGVGLADELKEYFIEQTGVIFEKIEERKKRSFQEKGHLKLKEHCEILRRFVRMNEAKIKKLKSKLLEGTEFSDSTSGDVSPK